MAKIVYNKNVSKPSDVTTSVFSNEEQLRYGEIVLCNSIDEPGVYIFTKNDVGETRIQKVNSIKNIMLDADVDPSETGEVVSGDSLNVIVSKLQNQINELVASGDTGDTKVSNIVAGVGLNPDGTYSAITGDYIATATSIADAIQLLDAAITSTAESTLQEAKDYADAKISESIEALDADVSAVNGEVFVKITEAYGVVSGDVKALSVEKDATGLKYDLKLGDYVYGSIDIPQDQFLEEVTFISAATVEDVAEALNYGQHIELGKPYLKFVWRLEEGLTPTYVDVSGLIDIYTAADVKLSDSYTGTSFNIHSGTSLEEAVGSMTTELTTIEESIAANEISSTEKTINISTANTGTSIDVNIDNDTIVKDETVASQGKLSVKLDVERQHIDSGYVRTQYTLKSSGSTYGIINDTRDVFVGDVDEYINVSTEPVSDAQGNRTDKITITPTIQKNISEAASESTEDGNGLVTAWGVKTYIKDGMDGDDIMVGDDNLLQYHPIEFWRGKINFDPQSIFYDTVHEAFFKTDNNMELLDNSLGFDSDGQQVHQYPSARTQDTLLIKDDRTVMDALKTLDKAIDEMDYSADTEENKVFTGITQTNGHVAVTSENLTSRKLAGYEVANVPNPSGATYKVAATDKLGQALGKLQGQINAMDWTGSTTENEVFTGITENDGLISATTKLLTNVKLSGYTVENITDNTLAASKVAATDTLGKALGKLQGQINSMDYTATTTSDQIFTGFTEADGEVTMQTANVTTRTLAGYSATADTKVAATQTLGVALGNLQGQINAMDYSANTGTDKVITGITQSDGKITVTSENITSRVITGYAEGTDADVAATDTLGQALGKLQKQINSMDYTANTGTDKVFTYVAEADGKLTTSAENITSRVITGYAVGSDAKIAATDTLGGALGKVQGQINAMDKTASSATGKFVRTVAEADGKVSETLGFIENTDITVCAATSSEIASLGANVKEAYKLVNANSATQLGEWIKIYKDSSIAEIYLGTSADTVNATTGAIDKKSGDKESLNYVYYTSGGTYSITHIDLETFLTEPEFKSGVTVTNHIAHGVVSGGSESVVTAYTATGAANGTAKVLGVDANGFYVSNIQKAIDAKVNSAVSLLDSSSATTGNRKYVTGITITDGKITSFAEAGDPTLTTGNSTTATGNVVTGLSVSDHAITLNKKNFPEVAFKTFAVGGTNIEADTTADTLTITTGNTAITLTPNAANDSFTIGHTDTSNQGNIAGGDGQFIKSVSLDTYGHVTAMTSGSPKTLTVSYGSSASTNATFNGTADKTIYIPNNTNQLTNGANFITSAVTVSKANSATTAADSDKLGGTAKGDLFTSFTSPTSATTSAPETSITVGGTEKKAKVNADMVDGKHIWTGSSLPATRSADTIYILI